MAGIAGGTAVDTPKESRFWRGVLWFFVDKGPPPIMRAMRRRNRSLPWEEFEFVGCRTGKVRRLLLGLFEVGGAWYIGHPNGTSNWIRNMTAAGQCTMVRRDGTTVPVMPSEVTDPIERERVIRAIGNQPPPAGPIFRGARRHILAVGRYFRLTPVEGDLRH